MTDNEEEDDDDGASKQRVDVARSRRVRLVDGSKSARFDGLSKPTKIEELREKIAEKFEIETERQLLFYRGKQLEDGHSLFDYRVGLNDIIQLMVRSASDRAATAVKTSAAPSSANGDASTTWDRERTVTPAYEAAAEVDEELEGAPFKVGDKVEARSLDYGAWFDAVVQRVARAAGEPSARLSSAAPSRGEASSSGGSGVLRYHVVFEGSQGRSVAALSKDNVRPRSVQKVPFADIRVGGRYLVKHRLDPGCKGFWYDADVVEKMDAEQLTARLQFGCSHGVEAMMVTLARVRNRVFLIRKNGEDASDTAQSTVESSSRSDEEAGDNVSPYCWWCKDVRALKCKYCTCVQCGDKDSPSMRIACNECSKLFHLHCLNPPLHELPAQEEWYCSDCKTDENEVIKAGEKLRISKAKSKLASSLPTCTGAWGKGMACVGVANVCSIVPVNHFGSIPGVPVGSLWRFRVQVSEAGVHRPHIAGIAGHSEEGAFSLVLSGSYEDKDIGEEFLYTGSGGRDYSGNKRRATQTADQQLTARNRALARSCHAVAVDDGIGAEARDWRRGKPVRVVRSAKDRARSQYAPAEGYRYDGLYKVVEYWPDVGATGLKIWRFVLRRDDPSPAPWTAEGKQNVRKLGLTLQYPDGYLERQEQAGPEKMAKSRRKRSAVGNVAENDQENATPKKRTKRSVSATATSSPSKPSAPVCMLDNAEKALIRRDSGNQKLWNELLKGEGEDFLKRVGEAFKCVCCQDLVHRPVSTVCKHNFCKACLRRCFKVGVHCCPTCRGHLDGRMSLSVNAHLSAALLSLFPGYGAGR